MQRLVTVFAIFWFATCLSAFAQTEVLYVATPQTGQPWSLATYNVDPTTAAAAQVGSAVNVESANIIPLTVGSLHVIYVWTHTDVWVYSTDASGVPASNPSQHLTFGFPRPVTSFVVDPIGKFAYGADTWTDANGNNYAAIYLLTIDPSNGNLTNTQELAATYGPELYVGYVNYSFGAGGGRLFAKYNDFAPFTCNYGYDEYPVNQTTGALGTLGGVERVDSECASFISLAVSDQLSGYSNNCCGFNSGDIRVRLIATGQQIDCKNHNFHWCGDIGEPYFDPASENLFFNDNTLNLLFVSRLDFTDAKLIPTAQLPATASLNLQFSPDDALFYSALPTGVNIYAFQAATGKVGASTTLSQATQPAIVATTLPKSE